MALYIRALYVVARPPASSKVQRLGRGAAPDGLPDEVGVHLSTACKFRPRNTSIARCRLSTFPLLSAAYSTRVARVANLILARGNALFSPQLRLHLFLSRHRTKGAAMRCDSSVSVAGGGSWPDAWDAFPAGSTTNTSSRNPCY